MDATVNWNVAEQCIKVKNAIGSTYYYNVCNGKTEIIPWHFGDYIGTIFTLILASLFTFLSAFFILGPFIPSLNDKKRW